ncbi:DNA binding HTH domain Psq-type, partial [Penicillium riverlandense]|uniref:DNA binding HTH domain Psq-type n=1 Tax=Penicillium riverlandense TaxID=1903569 RepID=UPI0025467FD2
RVGSSLVIRAYQNKEIPSICEATWRFDVPYSTLQYRFNGKSCRRDTRANNHKLTSNEDQPLLQSSQDSLEKEGRIVLAVQAIQKEEIRSIRETARRFNVSEATLRRRLRGITNR